MAKGVPSLDMQDYLHLFVPFYELNLVECVIFCIIYNHGFKGILLEVVEFDVMFRLDCICSFQELSNHGVV